MINRNSLNNLIERAFDSRIARNAFFWLFFGVLNFLNYFTVEGSKLFEILSLIQIAIILFSRVLVYGPIVYFNNLVLLPVLLEKKKYILYIISVLLLIIAGLFYVRFTVLWFSLQIPELNKDLIANNVPASAFLFATATMLLGFSMSKYATDYFNKKKNDEELQKETLIGELDLLKSQVNPHFLFNALNTIYGLSITNKNSTSGAIMQLSDILRYNLYECNTEKVPLINEINYVENYLEFAKLRRNNNSRIEFSKEGNFNDLMIAPLLFIPFIENSFKHGLDKSIKDAWVNIKIKADDQFITFVCGNSKHSGITENHKIHSGIGLQNVKRRLDLVYQNRYKLAIKEEGDFYSTILKIEI